jgi:hypothetical protein
MKENYNYYDVLQKEVNKAMEINCSSCFDDALAFFDNSEIVNHTTSNENYMYYIDCNYNLCASAIYNFLDGENLADMYDSGRFQEIDNITRYYVVNDILIELF